MTDPEDVQAWADQQVEGYKQITRIHAAFFKGLVDNGVPKDAAIPMACAYIRAIHGKPPEGGGP